MLWREDPGGLPAGSPLYAPFVLQMSLTITHAVAHEIELSLDGERAVPLIRFGTRYSGND
jgi:hypothetical protein